MQTSVEESWQMIDEMLRKKNRNREHGKALQEAVASVLGSSDGRQSITDRLGRKGDKFPGKARFLDEVVKAFERGVEMPPDATPKERVAVQQAVVEQTSPKTDQAHWNMLWLLEHDGHPEAGRMILQSLRKATKKADDFSRALPALDAWTHLAPERIVVVLEAANRSCQDAELARRIEPVLSWATTRLKKQADAKEGPTGVEDATKQNKDGQVQADGLTSEQSQSTEQVFTRLCGKIQDLWFIRNLRTGGLEKWWACASL